MVYLHKPAKGGKTYEIPYKPAGVFKTDVTAGDLRGGFTKVFVSEEESDKSREAFIKRTGIEIDMIPYNLIGVEQIADQQTYQETDEYYDNNLEIPTLEDLFKLKKEKEQKEKEQIEKENLEAEKLQKLNELIE